MFQWLHRNRLWSIPSWISPCFYWLEDTGIDLKWYVNQSARTYLNTLKLSNQRNRHCCVWLHCSLRKRHFSQTGKQINKHHLLLEGEMRKLLPEVRDSHFPWLHCSPGNWELQTKLPLIPSSPSEQGVYSPKLNRPHLNFRLTHTAKCLADTCEQFLTGKEVKLRTRE